MFDELGWFVVFIAVLLVVLFALELWIIVVISGFLASYFGFTGVLWWICAFMMFCIINSVIGAVWNMR